MVKPTTIHTHRTIMFKELEKVMDYSISDDSYFQALDNNVTGKKSADGIKQTARFLKIIYGFDKSSPTFKIFKFFWNAIDTNERELITFLYALNSDYLLSESIDVIVKTRIADKTTVESFELNVEKYHPNRFTKNTLRSVAQNIASSWKQAGFITGKVKNIRTQPEISYKAVAFAFIMAYLNGLRGDFIWSGKWVKALCLNENQLRDLAIEASKRGLIHYQYAGNVSSITCQELFNKLEINDI